MKRNTIVIIILAVAAVGVVAALSLREDRPQTERASQNQTSGRQTREQQPFNQPHSSSHDSQTTAAARVPAHFEAPPAVGSLPPTLEPEQFTGPTREAYRAVREIPQTIAQLPCYCHCDVGFGHKSLHSCFESDHGAHCAVCVNEVLMAYQMEKQLKMTPAQIRQSIVAQYGAAE